MDRHCEEQSDEAIQLDRHGTLREPRDDNSLKHKGSWYNPQLAPVTVGPVAGAYRKPGRGGGGGWRRPASWSGAPRRGAHRGDEVPQFAIDVFGIGDGFADHSPEAFTEAATQTVQRDREGMHVHAEPRGGLGE